MRFDEEDPKAPKPVRTGRGRPMTISPSEDPKQPSPVLTGKKGKKGTNVLELLEAQGRTVVVQDDLDRHIHV